MTSIGSFLLKNKNRKQQRNRLLEWNPIDPRNKSDSIPKMSESYVVELYASVNGLFVRLVAAVCVSCATGLGVAGPKFTRNLHRKRAVHI